MNNFKAMRIVQELASESMPSIYEAKDNDCLDEWREQWQAIEIAYDWLVVASTDGYVEIPLHKESRFS